MREQQWMEPAYMARATPQEVNPTRLIIPQGWVLFSYKMRTI